MWLQHKANWIMNYGKNYPIQLVRRCGFIADSSSSSDHISAFKVKSHVLILINYRFMSHVSTGLNSHFEIYKFERSISAPSFSQISLLSSHWVPLWTFRIKIMNQRPLGKHTSCALGHWCFQSQIWSPPAMAFMDIRQMVTAIVPTITSNGCEATKRPCSLKRRASIVTVTGLSGSPGKREIEKRSSTTQRRKLRWTDAHEILVRSNQNNFSSLWPSYIK